MNSKRIWTHPPDRTPFDNELYVIGCGLDIINGESNPRKRSKLHKIEFHILFFVEGGCYTRIGDEERIATAGDIVFFHTSTPYAYTYLKNTETKVFWIHFAGDSAENVLNDFGLNESFVKKSDTDLSPYFQNIADEMWIKKIHYNKVMEANLLLLFTAIVRKKLSKQSYLDEAISRMTNVKKKDLDLDEYAKICHLSKSQFIRNFKEHTGKTPMKFKNDNLIEKAKERLRKTDMSINEIASSLGFENVFYFSTSFKKSAGISPSEYRKKHQ